VIYSYTGQWVQGFFLRISRTNYHNADKRDSQTLMSTLSFTCTLY